MTTAIILSVIAVLAFVGWSVFVAEREAREDYKLIAANKPVAHTMMEWIERAWMVAVGFVAILFLWLMVAGSWEPLNWRLLLWIPMGWAGFTVSFRWVLNGKRYLNRRYLSKSNAYDRFWMALAGSYQKASTGAYPAGTAAYLFETAVLAASITLFIIKA